VNGRRFPAKVFDRSDLNLPGKQEELLESRRRCRPAGGAGAAKWPAADPGVGGQTRPGNSGKRGMPVNLAAGPSPKTLFGDNNPAGRLPVTFPRSAGQLPVYYNHFPSKKDSYIEGDSSPLFVFGHGLSYTTFQYDDLRITAPPAHDAEDCVGFLQAHQHRQNATARKVAQLYVRQETASVSTPVRSLKGFSRIPLKTRRGRKIVTFRLKQPDLAVWDAHQQWRVEPGEYAVTVGGSSSGGLVRQIHAGSEIRLERPCPANIRPGVWPTASRRLRTCIFWADVF